MSTFLGWLRSLSIQSSYGMFQLHSQLHRKTTENSVVPGDLYDCTEGIACTLITSLDSTKVPHVAYAQQEVQKLCRVNSRFRQLPRTPPVEQAGILKVGMKYDKSSFSTPNCDLDDNDDDEEDSQGDGGMELKTTVSCDFAG
nr:hypothetical protein Itr_chr03CG12440 [Ipomoea trifida]